MTKLTIEQIETIKVGEIYRDPYRGIPGAYFVVQEVEPMSTRFGKVNRIARGKVVILQHSIDWDRSIDGELHAKHYMYKIETTSIWVGDLKQSDKLSTDFLYFKQIKACKHLTSKELN